MPSHIVRAKAPKGWKLDEGTIVLSDPMLEDAPNVQSALMSMMSPGQLDRAEEEAYFDRCFISKPKVIVQ